MINKGTVSAILEGGKKVKVKPYTGEIVTVELVVPFFLFECLEVEMPVAYVTFEDNTGVVLTRMDGEWNHKIWDGVEIVTGDLKTHVIPSYHNHTHACANGGTGRPQ